LKSLWGRPVSVLGEYYFESNRTSRSILEPKDS
jgi:hypothetical protein